MDFIKKIKDFFGESNEVISSTVVALEERFTSPFYGYFVLAWFIVNWRLVYTAFFVGGTEVLEKENLLRNEYLFLNIPDVNTLAYWLHFIIFPFLITIFIFWVLPYISRFYYRQSIRNQKALKIIDLQERQEVKKEEKKLAVAEVAAIEQKAKKAKQIKKVSAETPEVLWAIEYSEFEKNPLINEFISVVKKVYQSDTDWIQISTSMGAFLDLNGLGSVSRGYQTRVTLTAKGKFFVKKYLQKNPII